MLMYDNASADQIARYLEWVAADYMSLGAGSADSDRAAQMVFALRREFQTPTQ
jgi:hypothetical protein